MRKALLEARALKRAAAATEAAAAAGESEEAAEKAEPVEWGRLFTEEDFDRIRCAGLHGVRVHRRHRLFPASNHSSEEDVVFELR